MGVLFSRKCMSNSLSQKLRQFQGVNCVLLLLEYRLFLQASDSIRGICRLAIPRGSLDHSVLNFSSLSPLYSLLKQIKFLGRIICTPSLLKKKHVLNISRVWITVLVQCNFYQVRHPQIYIGWTFISFGRDELLDDEIISICILHLVTKSFCCLFCNWKSLCAHYVWEKSNLTFVQPLQIWIRPCFLFVVQLFWQNIAINFHWRSFLIIHCDPITKWF